MTSSSSPVLVLSDSESDVEDAALSRVAAESFSSSLVTQASVDALCKKYGVPAEFAARPAGERRACTQPPPGAVCVYAHALEAGLRFPLHAFFRDALSQFGLAPGQLTPNGWRVLVCFVVLCHSAGVLPSVSVFRHFFYLRKRGWYFFRCKKGAGVLLSGLTSPKSEKEWKRGFFFLKSPEPWECPVRWGEPPSKITTRPVLSSQDNRSVAKLVYAHGAAVDLRTYLSEPIVAVAFSSNLAGASPAPLLALHSSRGSTGSDWMDLAAKEAVPLAEKVKAEPVGGTPQLSCKKRKNEEVAGPPDGLRRPETNTPPAAQPGVHATPLSRRLVAGLPTQTHSVLDAHDGDSADWAVARKVLERIVTPSRELEFAAAKPSDVVTSTYVAILQAANNVTFSLGHALELEEKRTAQERENAALREQLEEAKAEVTSVKQEAEAKVEKLKAELAAEVEGAKTAAVQQFLESDEYKRLVAEQALPAYVQGGEDMKHVALRLDPRLDAAKLVLPLD